MLCLSRLRSDQTALTSYLTALDRFAHGLMALGCGRDARRRHYTPVLRTLASDDTLPAPEKVFAIAAGDQRQILRRIATRLYVEDPATAKLVLIRADHATSGLPSAHYRQLMDPSRPSGDRYTVEHVCPKGTVTEGEWADLFPTRARRTSAAECIGNLVLVTEVQNKRVSQKDFAAKKQVFFPDATPSPFRLTEVLRGETRWGPEEIERRYDLVMRTIKQMWALEGNIPSCPATRPRPTPKPT